MIETGVPGCTCAVVGTGRGAWGGVVLVVLAVPLPLPLSLPLPLLLLGGCEPRGLEGGGWRFRGRCILEGWCAWVGEAGLGSVERE